MAEDVNLDGYDEDLSENPFFKFMQAKHKALYEEASKNRWVVCIPRRGTLIRSQHTLNDVENHILRTVEGNDSCGFKTVNGKEVQLNGEFILTTEGFQNVKSVRVLFEETFYNAKKESFQVLCIDQPLEGGLVTSIESAVKSLESLQNCMDFLWPVSGSKHTQQQIDDIVKVFNSTYQQLEGETLRHLMDATNAVYTRAMHAATKNSQLRKLAQSNRRFMDNVKLAIETYILYGLHDHLFRGISSILGHEDAALNKMTRNLADVQIRHLGIKQELCINLPRARTMLSTLNKYKTPLEKFNVLKNVVTIITERKIKTEQDDTEQVVTADDLLPALVFLVIKADIPNWLANITYLHNFHFSKSGWNEFMFYLSSVEAAVEHVRGGYLSQSMESLPVKRIVMTTWPQFDSIGHSGKLSPLEMLFEYTAEGHENEVEKMLATEENEKSLLEKMCHPLCSCDKCEKMLSSKRNDPSAVTVFSRDDFGRTVLHIAAEFGHADIVYMLIHKGAVVNAVDYHGSTPLHLACQRGHSNVAMLLIHYKADVNAPDNDGNTPMHLCTANGHDQCAKTLVYTTKAHTPSVDVLDINTANENGDTPLHLASRWGYADIVQLLLEKNASVEARNKKKETPLDCALNKQVTELLLDAAALSIAEHELSFAFLDEKRSSSVSSVSLDQTDDEMVSKRSSIERRKEKERNKQIDGFLRAVADGDTEMVRFRLSLMDDEEFEDEEDSTVNCNSEQDLCHPLCQCDKCSKWQKQSSRRAEMVVHANCCNSDGITPLHVATLRGYEDIASLLLKKGAQPSAKNHTHEQTPLHLACQYNHYKVAVLLLNHQVKINARDYKGNTPLHFCCSNGHYESARILLERGAKVDVQNNRGNTPLHSAARWNFVKLVRILLRYGAPVNVRNKMQLTPMQYAKHDDVVRVLDQAESLSFSYSPSTSALTLRKGNQPTAVLNSIGDSHEQSTPLASFPAPGSSPAQTSTTEAQGPVSIQTSAGLQTPAHAPDNCSSARSRSPVTVTLKTGVELTSEENKRMKLFQKLEGRDVEKLSEITEAVRAFDRRASLKKTTTIDKSSPVLDFHLLHQLSIKKFDLSILRKTETRDRSQPMIDVDEEYEADISEEDSDD